jgi:pentatricopeptide repeat protein
MMFNRSLLTAVRQFACRHTSTSSKIGTASSTIVTARKRPRLSSRNGVLRKQESNLIISYTNQIRKEISQGNQREAYRLFDSMAAKGIRRDVILYNVLLQDASKDRSKIPSLMKQMNEDNVTPTVRTYNTVMVSSSSDACLKWFREMQDRGIAPDAGTFNIMIKNAPKKNSKDLDFVENLYNQMKYEYRIQPNDYTYSSIFKACRQVSRRVGNGVAAHKKAEMFMNLLIDDSPKLSNQQFLLARNAASSMIGRTKCDKLCIQKGMQHLVNEDSSDGTSISNSGSNRSMQHAKDSSIHHLKHYKAPNAVSTKRTGSGSGVRGSSSSSKYSKKHQNRRLIYYNKAIKSALKPGSNIGGANTHEERLKRAHGLFTEMDDEGVTKDVVTYTTLIRGHLNDCNYLSTGWEEVNKLMTDMFQSRITPDIYLYNTVLVALARNAEKMASLSSSSSALLDNPRACYRQAEKVWSKILASRTTPDGRAFCSMIRTCIAADEGAGALLYFRQMLENQNESITMPSIEIARNSIASYVGQHECDKLLAENEDFVMNILSSSTKDSLQDATRTFASLIRGMCASGRGDKAVKICLEALQADARNHPLGDIVFDSGGGNGTTCNVLLRALCDAKEAKKAMYLMNEMTLSMGVTLDVVSYNHVLSSVARYMMDVSKDTSTRKASRMKDVRDMMQLAQQTFEDMRLQHWRWNCSLWLGGAENGKHSSATAEIADGWRQYPGGLSRGYGAIMMGCKAAGDAKLAETYFSQMMQDEESPTASSLSTSISAMGWQTSGVDERAVKAVLPLLRSTVGIEKYQSLCNIHEPTLTRIGTIATESGTTTTIQNVKYSRRIKRACDSGNYERGKLLFDQMAIDGIPRNVISWTTMIQGAFDAGKYGHAMLLFENMRHENVSDAAAYRMVMQKVLTLKGDIQLAMSLLMDMKKDHEDPLSSVVIDSRTYNILLNGMADRVRENATKNEHSNGKKLELLLPMEDLYVEMLRRNLHPDGHTYSAMIKGCMYAKEGDRALLYLDNMLVQIGEEVDQASAVDSSSKFQRMTKRDVDVCANQVSSIVGQEICNKILRKHQRVLDALNIQAIAAAAAAAAEAGKRQRAGTGLSSSLASLPSTQQLNYSDEYDIPSRTELLSLASIERLSTRKNELTKIFLDLCEAGATDLAYDLLNALVDHKASSVDLYVKNILLHGFCESGDMERATILFQDMTKNADRKGSSGPRPASTAPSASEYFKAGSGSTSGRIGDRPLLKDQADSVTYTTMIRGLLYNVEKDDLNRDGTECDRAIALFYDIKRFGIPLDSEAFHTIITGLCKNGRPDRAWALFEEMGELGLRDTAAYTTMINGFINSGDIQVAYTLFEEMEEEDTGEETSSVQRDIAVYDTMMQGFLKDGDLEQAWHIFDEAERHGVDRDASLYASLIGGLCHHYERAMDEQRRRKFQYYGTDESGLAASKSPPLLSIMPHVRVRSNLLLSDAIALFDEMKSLGLERDVQVYTQLIRSLCRAGRVDDAWMMFQSMKEERVAVLKEDGQGGEGANDEIEEQQYDNVPMYIDVVAYTTMLQGLCNVGQVDRALELFDEMGKVEAQELSLSNIKKSGVQQSRPFIRDVKAYTVLLSCLVQQTHRFQEDDDGTNDSRRIVLKEQASQLSNDVDSGWNKDGRSSDRWLMGNEEHQNNIEHAWTLFEDMRRSGMTLDTRSYATMLGGLARLENGLSRAEAMFLEMERLPNIRVDGQAYRAMVEAGCNDGTEVGKTRAIRYFEDMMDDWHRKGIEDRDFAVVERLLEDALDKDEWKKLVGKHKTAIEGIALGQGKTNMVRLSNIFRERFRQRDSELQK